MKKTSVIVVLLVISFSFSLYLFRHQFNNTSSDGSDIPTAETAASLIEKPSIAFSSSETQLADRIPAKPSRQNTEQLESDLKDVDRFTDAAVLQTRTTDPDNNGRYERKRLVRADFKYPLVLLEESLQTDPQTGVERLLKQTAMVADHVMVKVQSGVSETDVNRAVSVYGAHVRKKMYAPDLYLVEFQNINLDSVAQAIQAFGKPSDLIVNAEPDYIVYALSTTPNDPRFGELWGLHNTGQNSGTPGADIGAPEAWDITTGRSNILVAVIDSGIDYTHPDLAANMWINPGEAGSLATNGIDDDGNGFIDDYRGWDFCNDDNNPMDDNSHGTHCAGTIGAVGNNSTGVVGVCWNVSLVGIKFLSAGGSGANSDGIDAIYYATKLGCKLTSDSWGGGSYSVAMQNAITDAKEHGTLFIAAAGNSAEDNDVSPHYPSSYTNDNVIAVANSTRTETLSGSSCYGLTSVDLAAPGSSILSTIPNGGYGTKSGTSMATPHVAGAAALLWSYNPGMSAVEVKAALMGNVDTNAAFAGKMVSGGRLNVNKALRSLTGLYFDQADYFSSEWATLSLLDNRLAGSVSQSVRITTENGDTETLVLYETPEQNYRFTNRIWIAESGVAIPGNGQIESVRGPAIKAVYTNLTLQITNIAIASVISRPIVPETNIIVRWGMGNTNIVNNNSQVFMMRTSYTTNWTNPSIGTNYYPDSSNASPRFSSAFNYTGNSYVYNSSLGDNIGNYIYSTNGAVFRGMLMWRDFLTATNLTDIVFQGSKWGSSTTNLNIRLIVEKAGNYYISDAVVTDIPNAITSYSISTAGLNWNSFKPFTNGVETIGGSTSVTMDNLTGIGYYFTAKNCYTNTGTTYFGVRMYGFEARNEFTEPATNPVLDYVSTLTNDGDSDGRNEPGETINAYVLLSNEGSAASNVTAIVVPQGIAASNFEVSNSPGSFGTIATGGRGSNSIPFVIMATNPAAPLGTYTFGVTGITSDDPNTVYTAGRSFQINLDQGFSVRGQDAQNTFYMTADFNRIVTNESMVITNSSGLPLVCTFAETAPWLTLPGGANLTIAPHSASNVILTADSTGLLGAYSTPLTIVYNQTATNFTSFAVSLIAGPMVTPLTSSADITEVGGVNRLPGQSERGEVLDITVLSTNNGAIAVSNVISMLSADPAYFAISNLTSFIYPSISLGAVTSVVYRVNISPTTPKGIYTFYATNAAGAYFWADTFNLSVTAQTNWLTVAGGSGDGFYMELETVPVVANTASPGQRFNRWAGDTQCVSDVTATSTTVTMPAQAVQILATYADNYDHKPGLSSLGKLFDDPTADAEAIVYSNGYAYVACGYAGLVIFDVSNPSNPIRVGGYDTDGFAKALAVQSNKVFIADDRFGFQIVDVTDPANPVLAGKYVTGGSAYDIAVSGSYVYLAAYSSGMLVFDVSNPVSPQLIKSYNAGTTRAYGIAIDGNYAYVADYTNGLKIIDISAPANPVLTGSYPVTGQSRDVAVSGGYAYVAAYTNGLQIINVSSPSSPSYAGGYVTNYYSYGVAVDGSYAYLASSGYGLGIIDISNPSAPVLSSVFDDNKGSANGVSVVSGKVCVANDYGGIQIVDVSEPTLPALLGSFDTHRYAYDVAVKGSYAYLAAYRDGLITVDISNPDAPVVVATNKWTTSPYAYRLDISGDYLYVAANSDGLVVYNLFNPAAPSLVTNYDFVSSGYIRDVKVSSNYAFCVNGSSTSTNTLGVVNVSDPAHPFYVGEYKTGGFAYGIDVQGQYAYLASYTNGLQIFDVSTPSAPVLKGAYKRTTSSCAYNISVSGNYAYVLDFNDVLQIVDIQNPDTPTLRQILDLGMIGGDSDILVQAPYVYIAYGYASYPTNNGLWVVDVRNMDKLVVTNYLTSGYGRGVAVSGGYVYLADDPKLLHVFTFGEKEPTGISIDGASQLIANSTNTYTCRIQYTDGSSSNATDVATWSLIGTGATLNGNMLSVGDIASDSTVTVRAVYGIFTNNFPVTLKFIPAGLTPLGTLSTNATADAEAIVYSNGYAYVACGNAGVLVFDVSNPANMVKAGGYDTEGDANGLTLRSNLLFVADGNTDLLILNVNNPSNPVPVGRWKSDYDPAYVRKIVISGQYAYLAAGTRGFLVLDISNISDPRLVSDYDTANAYGVAIDGNYAYVADYTNGLKILDVSTPTNPVLTASYSVTGQARDVAVRGGYAYMAAGTNGLQIINVSNPSAPSYAGGYVTNSSCSIILDGDFAYLANSGYGLGVINISNPFAPVPVGMFDDNKGSAIGVFVADGKAFVANGYGGIQIVDVSVLSAPILLGSYDTHRYAYDVAVKGSYAYLAGYRDGLITVDISNPDAPVAVATNKWVTGTQYAYGVDIVGDTLYIAPSGGFGLIVYDISSPASPALITAYNFATLGSIQDVQVYSNYAYCVNASSISTNALAVVDVRNPGNPFYVSGYNTGGAAYDVEVQDQYAYLASGTNGLQIFNISNPSNIALTASYIRPPINEFQTQPSYVRGIAVSGNYAYMLDSGGVTLTIVDVSDRQSPELTGLCNLGGYGADSEIFVQYPYVFIAYDTGFYMPERNGLWIIDVSDPADPVVVADYPTSGYSRGVTVNNGHVYLADDPKGLHTFTWGAVPASAKSVTNFVVYRFSGGNRLETLSAKTTNSYEGYVEYSDRSLQSVSTSAVWTVTGEPQGSVFNQNHLTADGVTSNGAVITVQGSYGGFSDTLDVTLYYDRNTNGVPDWWELQYSGGITGINPDAICSNGFNTLREAYIAGLDPNNPQSLFLTSILPGRVLQWNAVSGRIYSVYWTTNLMSGFQPLETNICWPQDTFNSPTSVPCGYYKIGVRLE